MMNIRACMKAGGRWSRRFNECYVTRVGISLPIESAKKVDEYLERYGEFEAYNSFGGRTIESGIRRMVQFYKHNPDAPV